MTVFEFLNMKVSQTHMILKFENYACHFYRLFFIAEWEISDKPPFDIVVSLTSLCKHYENSFP